MPDDGAEKGLHGMSKQVVLLRVGVDAGCGGIQGPLFKDDTFNFVCIPDFTHQKDDLVLVKGSPGSGLFLHTHQISSEEKDRAGKPLTVLSPAKRKVIGDLRGATFRSSAAAHLNGASLVRGQGG